MTHRWGRIDAAGIWPNRKPVWTLAILLIAIATGLGVGVYRYQTTWTPLQRVYLPAYLRSALATIIAAHGRYELLEVLDHSNPAGRLVLDEEVTPFTENGVRMFALSDAGRAVGDQRLVWEQVSYDHAALHRLLEQWIYLDQTLTDLAAPAAWTALAVFGVGLLVAVPQDAVRRRSQRLGRRLKGPELVSVGTFNHRTRGKGVAVFQRPSVAAQLVGHRPTVRLPRGLESSHFLLIGDTGTGKSTMIRQLLQQIQQRGDAAIIYDPAREFLGQFYDPERGDVILNPLDTRCPFWSPGDEVRHEAEALTLATSLFPDRDHTNPFFTDAPRRIFAHLLTYHPTAQSLVQWLCDKEELERRMAGTPYAAMIDRDAPTLVLTTLGRFTRMGHPPLRPATPKRRLAQPAANTRVDV